MAERAQTFQNHKRFLPLWHFFVTPVLLINVGFETWRLINGPNVRTGWNLVVALALFFGIFLSRLMPLTAQDRLIRLEERARMARLLPPDLRGRENDLTRGQYVALRFAPDDEIPELVRRVHAGELKTAGDIKRAITNWRADHLRV
jgi:hypothetical protein